MRNGLLVSAVGLTVVFFAGCNFTQKYCERAIDCMGEEYMTVDQCVTASDDAAAAADTAGCGSEYDDASTCSYKESECTDSLYTSGTACETEATVYVECMTAAATEKSSPRLDPLITGYWY